MRLFLFATYIFSSLALANTPAVDRTDITNSIREDMLEARGRKEASEALLLYKEAKLKRVETLTQKSASTLSELELARAERSATVSLIGWMKEEELSNELRLKLLDYMGRSKEQTDPKVQSELSKAIEAARCRKNAHRRDHFAAYADYYTREAKRNERLFQRNAISLEELQFTESRRLENAALEKTWSDFLKDCPAR